LVAGLQMLGIKERKIAGVMKSDREEARALSASYRKAYFDRLKASVTAPG
jgi:hypothetical protein